MKKFVINEKTEERVRKAISDRINQHRRVLKYPKIKATHDEIQALKTQKQQIHEENK